MPLILSAGLCPLYLSCAVVRSVNDAETDTEENKEKGKRQEKKET